MRTSYGVSFADHCPSSDKGAHLPPARLEVLEHQVAPHFCNLELGEVTHAAALVTDFPTAEGG
jgi:hypothetical protein